VAAMSTPYTILPPEVRPSEVPPACLCLDMGGAIAGHSSKAYCET
jgi:hypothetical protein